ncbi:hypothetical protein BN59_01277 [Legionella massiliensis]|uniref:Uncharacterized protein n=1 Tax=Legionella massiliensis TaxID=1034943 RepID=A0A078KZ56_9GAMM|nr:hypothetical protein [Legionella massiliensis]CDZ76998.1 hypothetical protein BN59_01277 [Legionella massiliensis]CEE12736.1 hypothetical protein BN1094_01277 [Legionella massiliensis]
MEIKFNQDKALESTKANLARQQSNIVKMLNDIITQCNYKRAQASKIEQLDSSSFNLWATNNELIPGTHRISTPSMTLVHDGELYKAKNIKEKIKDGVQNNIDLNGGELPENAIRFLEKTLKVQEDYLKRAIRSAPKDKRQELQQFLQNNQQYQKLIQLYKVHAMQTLTEAASLDRFEKAKNVVNKEINNQIIAKRINENIDAMEALVKKNQYLKFEDNDSQQLKGSVNKKTNSIVLERDQFTPSNVLADRKEMDNLFKKLEKNIDSLEGVDEEVKLEIKAHLAAGKDFFYNKNDVNFQSPTHMTLGSKIKNGAEGFGGLAGLGSGITAIIAGGVTVVFPPAAVVTVPVMTGCAAVALTTALPAGISKVGTTVKNGVKYGAAPSPGELVNISLLGTSLFTLGFANAVPSALAQIPQVINNSAKAGLGLVSLPISVANLQHERNIRLHNSAPGNLQPSAHRVDQPADIQRSDSSPQLGSYASNSIKLANGDSMPIKIDQLVLDDDQDLSNDSSIESVQELDSSDDSFSKYSDYFDSDDLEEEEHSLESLSCN